VKVYDELVYLYYFVNTGNPATDGQVQRATINPQLGFFNVSSTITVAAPYHVNPDVHIGPNGFEMLYDSGTPFAIQRLVSSDGASFTPDPTFPGINGAPSYRAFTGHTFTVPGTNDYWLYFGWGPAATNSLMGWRWHRN
jgi:hypothetical protein